MRHGVEVIEATFGLGFGVHGFNASQRRFEQAATESAGVKPGAIARARAIGELRTASQMPRHEILLGSAGTVQEEPST